MKAEERIKKVKELENLFIVELMLGLFNSLVSTDVIKMILKEYGDIEVGDNFNPQQLSLEINSILPELLEKKDYCEEFYRCDDQNLKFLRIKYRQNNPESDKFKIDNIINKAKVTYIVIDEFLTLYNYINMIPTSYMNADKELDPIELFKKYINTNKLLIKTAKKTPIHDDSKHTIYDVSKIYFDKHLTPEFKELLSVEKLKEELAAELKESKETDENKKVVSYYKNANAENELIDRELGVLKNIAIASDEIKKIENEKIKFNKTFGDKFVAVDDESMISVAREYLAKIIISINNTKNNIADALIYAGDDIKDILREKHSYQIREYIEKLAKMSEKYGKTLSSADMQNSDELLALYKKAMAMYKVVDEMKANSYVVDISRFSK